MRSKARIKGHPIHPILVSFPIAFFVGTLIMDIVSLSTGRDDLQNISMFLEARGIIFGLLAAVPGFIDFLFTVPPNSSGKKRAATHGILNVAMVAIFSTAFLLRYYESASLIWITLLEGVGVILLMISGWLGGTLVFRNQIGVDIRYADAGKWDEKYFNDQQSKIQVISGDELKVNQMKLIHVNGLRIVIGRTENGYTAFDDRCTHRGGSLAGGVMICGTVQCPWHGSQFEVNTGNKKAGPAEQNIKIYPMEERDGKIFLHLQRDSL